jgi:hypothetical protein
MPGVSGVTVVTNARAYYSTRAAAGASGARHSLRPRFRGREISGTTRANCVARMRSCVFVVIACDKREAFAQGSEATKQSSFPLVLLWIASRSLSSGAHSRDPLARNDGSGCLKFESGMDANVCRHHHVLLSWRRRRGWPGQARSGRVRFFNPPSCPDARAAGRSRVRRNPGRSRRCHGGSHGCG